VVSLPNDLCLLLLSHLNCPYKFFYQLPNHIKILVNDDVGMVEKIYARAGLRMTGEARAVLRQFVDAHKGDYGGVICDLKGQFGVDPNELRKRFSFYFEAFPDT